MYTLMITLFLVTPRWVEHGGRRLARLLRQERQAFEARMRGSEALQQRLLGDMLDALPESAEVGGTACARL